MIEKKFRRGFDPRHTPPEAYAASWTPREFGRGWAPVPPLSAQLQNSIPTFTLVTDAYKQREQHDDEIKCSNLGVLILILLLLYII